MQHVLRIKRSCQRLTLCRSRRLSAQPLDRAAVSIPANGIIEW